MHTPAQFATDVLRLVMWLVILAVIFVPIERTFALRKTKTWRAGFGNDLAYYFLSSLLPAVLLAAPLSLMAIACQRTLPAAWANWSVDLPFWARALLVMVVGEIGTYWGHRWTHTVPFLWRFHSLHHSPEDMDWLVNSRAHPVDMVFVRLCGAVPLFAFGLAQPSGAGATLAALSSIFGTLLGFFIHSNVRWRFGFLEQLIATPAFHHWHHSRHEHINRNYAAMFPWVDRLFGSLHLPRDQWPRAYGIDTPTPTRFDRQLIEPLLASRAMATDQDN